MKTCFYCGRPSHTGQDFCCDNCKKNYTHLMDKTRKKIKYSMAMLILAAVLLVMGILAANSTQIAAGIMLIGITIVFMPLFTVQMVEKTGYLKLKSYERIAGAIIVIIGLIVR